MALGYPSLALASALDCQSLALYLEVVLDTGLENSNFMATNPAPASILTSVKKYLDFIPEQSCSAGSGFVEDGPSGSRFSSTPSPAGKNLLQHSHLGTGSGRQGHRVFSHSGLFMRPHRARMGDRMLSDLVLLKCIKHV